MKKTLLLVFTCSLAIITASAQDFDYGKVTPREIGMQRYDNDTSAHAVVLDEYGTAKIDEMNDNSIRIIYQHHTKIKIFDSKAFALGNVAIGLSNNDNNAETLEAVRGITTYTDDDGSVKTAQLDPSKVYKNKVNRFFTQAKFAMPSVRKGCIIEYDYITSSPFLGHFPSWYFQSNIPKIHSAYDVHQPGFWTYNMSLRGSLKLTKNVSEIQRSCFSARGSNGDCLHLVLEMDDIPAFITETDMTSPANYLSSINFQLQEFKNISTGAVTSYAKDWADVDNDFRKSDNFGAQLKKKSIFKVVVDTLLKNKKDTLSKAKAIYQFIQTNIKWNNVSGAYCTDGLRKAMELHTGDCAEVNLALVAALSEAGIKTDPVLISTRDHGQLNKLYPITDGFNYVIASVSIAGVNYLLDATDPLLPFGILPLKCLNDQGRLMSQDKPSSWIDINTGQKKAYKSTIDLTLMPDGKLKGTLVVFSTGYEAYEKRKRIKQFNSIDEYIQSLDEKSTKYRYLSLDISNLDSLNEALTETYQIELNEYSNLDDDHVTFNQFLFDHIVNNPFRLAERNYPVDKGMPFDAQISLTLHLPDNFVIDAPPKLKSETPSTTETIVFKAPDFASMANDKVNFSINQVSRISRVPSQVFNRTTDVLIPEGFTNQDEYTYTIPAGYHLQTKPFSKKMEKQFGSYLASVRMEGNEIIYTRKLELTGGIYPKSMYQDLVDFYQYAYDTDAHNIILEKNR